MKKIKSYTNIWVAEKAIYAINDFQLSFPVTLSQMAWFVLPLLLVIVFAHVSPPSMIEGVFLKYLGASVVVTRFMSQKTSNGEKPLRFLRSFLSYHLQFEATSVGRKAEEQKKRWDKPTTLVRSVGYVPD